MANKQFSVLSWNVEHFGRGKNKDQKEARVTRVADKIKSLDPDVMAIYEVEGKELFSEFSKNSMVTVSLLQKEDNLRKYSLAYAEPLMLLLLKKLNSKQVTHF